MIQDAARSRQYLKSIGDEQMLLPNSMSMLDIDLPSASTIASSGRLARKSLDGAARPDVFRSAAGTSEAGSAHHGMASDSSSLSSDEDSPCRTPKPKRKLADMSPVCPPAPRKTNRRRTLQFTRRRVVPLRIEL